MPPPSNAKPGPQTPPLPPWAALWYEDPAMTAPTLQRILFVEDDPDIQVVAKLALEAVGGLSVLACGSGAEALSRLSDFGPDLVLLDVMMPGMDGPTMLETLRRLPDATAIPVVFITARVQSHEIAHYRELGAADVIAKPFDPMTLADTVQSIWRSLHA
jgi:two-component system, OmpR family, response regulator